MAYCGIATQSSRLRWGIVVLLAVLAVLMSIGSSVEYSKCRRCVHYESGRVTCASRRRGIEFFSTSMDSSSPFPQNGTSTDDQITRIYRDSCSSAGLTALFFLFWICVIGSTIPCCINCCCVDPPLKPPDSAMHAVATGEPVRGDAMSVAMYEPPEHNRSEL